jgi:hypothetical protein
MASSAASDPRPRGLPIVPVLVAGGVAGVVLGVALGLWQQGTSRLEDSELERHVQVALPTSAGQEADLNAEAMLPDPELSSALPSYPGSSPRRLMEEGLGPGSRYSVAWFITFDPAPQVVAFYDAQLRAKGLEVVSHQYSDTMGYAAWFDHAHTPDGGPLAGQGTLYMASVIEEDGRTYVFLSLSEPEKLLDLGQQDSFEGITLPPGGHPLAFNTGHERRLTTVRAEWGALPVAHVVPALQEQYREQGWTVATTLSSTERVEFTATRGPALHSVVAVTYQSGSELYLSLESAR